MNLLEQGIQFAKAGNKQMAVKCLTDIVKQEPTNITAWLWLSSVLDEKDKKRYCLECVLKIDPINQSAHIGLSKLNNPIDEKTKPNSPTSSIGDDTSTSAQSIQSNVSLLKVSTQEYHFSDPNVSRSSYEGKTANNTFPNHDIVSILETIEVPIPRTFTGMDKEKFYNTIDEYIRKGWVPISYENRITNRATHGLIQGLWLVIILVCAALTLGLILFFINPIMVGLRNLQFSDIIKFGKFNHQTPLRYILEKQPYSFIIKKVNFSFVNAINEMEISVQDITQKEICLVKINEKQDNWFEFFIPSNGQVKYIIRKSRVDTNDKKEYYQSIKIYNNQALEIGNGYNRNVVGKDSPWRWFEITTNGIKLSGERLKGPLRNNSESTISRNGQKLLDTQYALGVEANQINGLTMVFPHNFLSPISAQEQELLLILNAFVVYSQLNPMSK